LLFWSRNRESNADYTSLFADDDSLPLTGQYLDPC
jgi:hypothetical protein